MSRRRSEARPRSPSRRRCAAMTASPGSSGQARSCGRGHGREIEAARPEPRRSRGSRDDVLCVGGRSPSSRRRGRGGHHPSADVPQRCLPRSHLDVLAGRWRRAEVEPGGAPLPCPTPTSPHALLPPAHVPNAPRTCAERLGNAALEQLLSCARTAHERRMNRISAAPERRVRHERRMNVARTARERHRGWSMVGRWSVVGRPTLRSIGNPTDRAPGRRPDRPTDRHSHRPDARPGPRPPDTPTDRASGRHPDRPTDRPTARRPDRPTDRPADTPTAQATDNSTTRNLHG